MPSVIPHPTADLTYGITSKFPAHRNQIVDAAIQSRHIRTFLPVNAAGSYEDRYDD